VFIEEQQNDIGAKREHFPQLRYFTQETGYQVSWCSLDSSSEELKRQAVSISP
jgi:hypothetical protein